MRQLNIKNDEAYAIAESLAANRGESMTAVVVGLLKQEADRVKPPRKTPEHVARIIERVNASLEPLHRRMREDKQRHPTTEEFDAWMYDENGLPR